MDPHALRGPGDAEAPPSSLFGDRRDLIVIHAMGSGCPHSTLWADGLVALLQDGEDGRRPQQEGFSDRA